MKYAPFVLINQQNMKQNVATIIDCLSRIKKCALCRKQLLKAKLCIEIKTQTNKSLPYEVCEMDYNSALNFLRSRLEGLIPVTQWRGVTYSN